MQSLNYNYLMADKPYFAPTAENTYTLELPAGENTLYDFAEILKRSRRCERKGEIEKACDMRFEAFQRLAEIIPDDEEIILDWDNKPSRGAMELLQATAIDHFLAGDFEMAAAMLELLLELDPEDHMEATKQLAYSYIALEEHEMFDEIINDISDKYPEKEIIKLWSEFRRTGTLPDGELTHLKRNLRQLYKEFTAQEHPADGQYLEDIESGRPSKEAVAREIWLQTEHLWSAFPDFIAALKNS